MYMVFSSSNVTIIFMTVIVIFCSDYSNGSSCTNELVTLEFNIKLSGFENLFKINDKLSIIPQYHYKNGLEKYKKFAQSSINDYFLNKFQLNRYKYGMSYISELLEHVLNPERMLSVTTWCTIHENYERDLKEFLENESYVEYNQDIYNTQYAKRIARNTGLPRSDQIVVFKTINVCYKEMTTKVPEVFQTFNRLYNTSKNEMNLDPLSWCAVDACYDSLIKADFEDVSANENIRRIFPDKINETHGGYAKHFYEYLKILSNKQMDNIYQIVSPYESNISIRSGYLRNWCGYKVCHDDLIEAGFIYEHASDNFNHVLPTIKMDSFISKFVTEYREHLMFIRNTTNKYDVRNNYEIGDDAKYHNFANHSPRSPQDFCKFTVINLDNPEPDTK